MDEKKRPIRILVSRCLIGDNVRYNGGHKHDHFVAEILSRFVEWEKICPEVESGMPVPRPSMHLVGDPTAPRLISRTGEDLTQVMTRFIKKRLEELELVELCGYVCKKDSPSSGMARVKVYDGKGNASRNGAGLFTAAFKKRFPSIPVEEEGRLQDPRLRESFITRIFCRRRWLDMIAGGRSRAALVDFHARHKLLILSHGRTGYTELGRLVASAKNYGIGELFAAYESKMMKHLARPINPKQVTDVLMHIMGFFKKALNPEDKAELIGVIDEYRLGKVPLIAPVTLLKHYARKFPQPYLSNQVFLDPYPGEFMLRTFV
jgi:uncharacterized protein YbgA (DUF1722 family)/uncharacterized protein YbbK (DUF523 family)